MTTGTDPSRHDAPKASPPTAATFAPLSRSPARARSRSRAPRPPAPTSTSDGTPFMSTLFRRLSRRSTRRVALAWLAAALLAISAVVLFGPGLAGASLGTPDLAAPQPAPVVSAESAGDLAPEASAALEQLEQLT